MRRIAFTKAHIISERERDSISEALEIAALALGQSAVEERRMLSMIAIQSESLDALMKLQQKMVDAINAVADENGSAEEVRERMFAVLGEFVEAA